MNHRCMLWHRGTLVLVAGAFFSGVISGCSNGNGGFSQKELAEMKNPPKQMPAEAAEYMRSHAKGPSGPPPAAQGK
jgi:hypothetical protein